jgi:hypothetical protein
VREAAVGKIAIDKIRTDGGTQAREEIDHDVAGQYADAMAGGAKFPEPVLFHDGKTYWLADGFHRVAAMRANGATHVVCDIRQGDRRAAILFSVGANAKHGLRRTNVDKRRAVMLLLGDEEWVKKSDRWIAEKCGVHHEMVSKLRPELAETASSPTARTGQDGKTRKLPVRRPSPSAAEPANDEPEDEPYEPEVFDGDDPPAAAPPEPDRSWGSFDVSEHVFHILSACKDAETRLASLYRDVDPRFANEVRTRAQDSVLRLMRALDDLLPPDGARAEANRTRFGVVTGGKGK